MKLWT